MAENLSNQSVPEAAARVAAVVNRLVNRIGSNAESRERLAEIEIPEELRDNLALFLRLERRVLASMILRSRPCSTRSCRPRLWPMPATPVAVPLTRPSTSRACPPPTSPPPWHSVRSSI